MSDQQEWDKQTQDQKAERVLNYLNQKTGSKFKCKSPSGKQTSNAKIIIDRVKEGYTGDEFKRVISMKCDEWGSDEKMSQYLRPSSLFRKSNFEQYVAVLDQHNKGGRRAMPIDQEPNVNDVLEDFIGGYSRSGASWGYEMPENSVAAAAWWLNKMQSPCGKFEKPQLVEKKGGGKYWSTPFIDRVLLNLRIYLSLSRPDQVIVFGCIDEGVPWNGDPIERYYSNKYSIYNEHMIMREMGHEDYKKRAKNVTSQFINGAQQ